jgi:glycosyltransferase involved in cell wall biosynthesis
MTGAEGSLPLVSVGIPTYNRARTLERAVRSVLAQDHDRVEVIISDDGSGDETAELCRRLAAQDPRVSYERQPSNLGHAANFRRVLELSRGEWFMWLSDDDHLERAYIRRCLEELCADATLAGVCGRGRYHVDGAEPVLERPINLVSRRAGARVVRYFGQVTLNGALYCVFPRVALASVPFREVMGGDWIVVGAMACRGRLRTLDDVHIERSAAGISADATALAGREFGLRGWRVRHPHIGIGWDVFRYVAREEPAYATLGRLRPALGALAGTLVAGRFMTIGLARAALARFGLVDLARRVIEPLRSARHR